MITIRHTYTHTHVYSDDRSPEVFHQRIQSSTQMQAGLTPDSRPNCLILDEIDGAPSVRIVFIYISGLTGLC